METGPKDYGISGTSADKAFNALGSLGTMAFAYNTVILPEIQVSTAHLALQKLRSDLCLKPLEGAFVVMVVLWSNAVICRSHVLVYSTDMYHCNAWHESTTCCMPFCSASLPVVPLTTHAESGLPCPLLCCLTTRWCPQVSSPRFSVDKSKCSPEFIEACLDTFGEEQRLKSRPRAK